MTSFPTLTVASHAVDGEVVVAVAGELDIATVPVLRRAVDVARAEAAARRLVVDLRDVAFLDSSAIHLCVDLDRVTREAEQPVAFVAGPAVKRVLGLAGMADALILIDAPA